MLDTIKNYVTPGTISAVLAFVAIIAGAFGQESLKAFLNDPSTAQTILSVVGGVLALVAGVAKGVEKKPTE